MPDPLATIVPAMPEERMCVVLTGRPSTSAASMVANATSSADAPCAYVRCALPIFSPTVTTMRFQPIIVPSPSARDTAILTVKIAVSLALGLGTMIGWKRIVVTVGEKIGKAHLTYAQGASAELVAFATIEAADVLGLPVSTTHILSSGIAGTMVANGSGIQKETVRNIVLAWVLTLPVCVLLGAALFGAALFFVLRVLGVH